MPLPFKYRPLLSNTIKQITNRFTGLQRKLVADNKLKAEYEGFMDEILAKGHAEPTSERAKAGQVWYIPHFAVRHPRKNKIRIVFHCSVKFEETSVNDKHLQRQDMMNNLLGIVCRFRLKPIAIVCNIEKTFYSFRIAEEEARDYLRFLWLDENGQMTDYKMTAYFVYKLFTRSCQHMLAC